jgi:hypothetical protein
MRTNESAMDNFIGHIRQAEDLLDLVADHLGNHMEKDPESITWADAGDAARIREMVQDIVSAFGLKER